MLCELYTHIGNVNVYYVKLNIFLNFDFFFQLKLIKILTFN